MLWALGRWLINTVWRLTLWAGGVKNIIIWWNYSFTEKYVIFRVGFIKFSRATTEFHIFWGAIITIWVGSACVLVGSDNNEWYMCWLMLYHIFDELAQLILVSWLVWFMRWVVFMFQILHMFILLVHDFKVQQLVLLMIGLFYVNFDERDHASSYWASKSCFMRWVILVLIIRKDEQCYYICNSRRVSIISISNLAGVLYASVDR
jgi:hypothetical protein